MTHKKHSDATLKGKNRAKESCFLALFIAFLLIPSVSARTYCSGDNLVEEIQINGETVTIDNLECQYGCQNESYIMLGYPSCQESDILMVFLAIILIILFIALMRWFLQ